MNIYLDIDGVILGKDTAPANYVGDFLKHITENYPVYWLTTHCKGDSDYTISFLSHFLDPETLEYAKKIKPTNWNLAKTEAIDFSAPFLWFDDNLFEFEKQVLIKHNALDRWVEINLLKNLNQLKDLLNNFPAKNQPAADGAICKKVIKQFSIGHSNPTYHSLIRANERMCYNRTI